MYNALAVLRCACGVDREIGAGLGIYKFVVIKTESDKRVRPFPNLDAVAGLQLHVLGNAEFLVAAVEHRFAEQVENRDLSGLKVL